jgi:sugar/nucleoside kinase (ribokinase family)
MERGTMSVEQHAPVIAGTGLICLDAIEPDVGAARDYRLFAGGSSLNVCAILHEFGWKAYPVGVIGHDSAGDLVRRDLQLFDMDTRWIHQHAEICTPVYVQHSDEHGHWFSRHCPFCQHRFADYTPLSISEADAIADSLPERMDVFFLERVSEGTLHLARRCKEKGALIYLELNRMGDEHLFLECLKMADVFKYSHEKLPSIQAMTEGAELYLEIETIGKDGLRYRHAAASRKSGWYHLTAQPVEHFLDACGSGDWVSAILLRELRKNGEPVFPMGDVSLLHAALVEGQRYAARNCAFQGARGLLYETKSACSGDPFCSVCKSQ